MRCSLLCSGYCPREGYKVASCWLPRFVWVTGCYCPREGYKVASGLDHVVVGKQDVTVPVRGIRLHHELQAGVDLRHLLLSP